MELKSIITDVTLNHPIWGEYSQMLLDEDFIFPKKGTSDDKAHPPSKKHF
jgi:predicted transcriptional regulator